ncbi:MAG: SDR family oxidoreductase [Myxococcota bacterium]
MSVFLTGGSGFLGSYVLHRLLTEHRERVAVLTRAACQSEAVQKLWSALQLHLDAEEFFSLLPKIHFIYGDITRPDLGISQKQQKWILDEVDSILHAAASLNRKSERACMQTNLVGTLSTLELARALEARDQLRRYSFVSTSAVCGHRKGGETLSEDEVLNLEHSDYDPYARTKKFCEHMVQTLLPSASVAIFRPSTVMGDSRFAATSQFDMVRAFCLLADLPFVPIRPSARQDIVNANWVGRSIETLHMRAELPYRTFNLSAGPSACTAREIVGALAPAIGKGPRFVPKAKAPLESLLQLVSQSSIRNHATHVASLMKVFLPYFTFDTVLDNERTTTLLETEPTAFTDYCLDLYRYAKRHNFSYPYRPLPQKPSAKSSENVTSMHADMRIRKNGIKSVEFAR